MLGFPESTVLSVVLRRRNSGKISGKLSLKIYLTDFLLEIYKKV